MKSNCFFEQRNSCLNYLDKKKAKLAQGELPGSAERGKTVFTRSCAQCHTYVENGANLQGPNLFGVVGRHSGKAPGYNYTDANKNANVIWSPESLNEYLTNPVQYIPGTKMNFAGLRKSRDRENLIKFLTEQK